MDNRNNLSANAFNPLLKKEINKNRLQLSQYKDAGRVAIIAHDPSLLNALQHAPESDASSQASFELFSWLADKPRLPKEKQPTYLLSTLDEAQFSGFTFHPSQNLFVDSFNSNKEWVDGDKQPQSQLADLLLPSGQWHRHYDTVILSAQANDKQVELIQHWLALTNGSVLIIHNKEQPLSLPIQALIANTRPVLLNQTDDISPSAQHTLSGISVTCYDPDNREHAVKNRYVIQELDGRLNEKINQLQPTHWVYEGVITVPKADYIPFMLSSFQPENNLILEINQQVITIEASNGYGGVHLSNLQQGQQIPFKISTKTMGEAPQIRFDWGLPGRKTMEMIPSHAIRHSGEAATNEHMSSAFNPSGFQQVVSLPPAPFHCLQLTDELRDNAEYFSLKLQPLSQNSTITLDDIRLAETGSWEALAKDIEEKSNIQLAIQGHPPIHVTYANNNLIFSGDKWIVSQIQLKQKKDIHYVDVYSQIYSSKQDNSAKHQIILNPNNINNFTHVSLKLKDSPDDLFALSRVLFKSPDTNFASPQALAKHLQTYLQTHLKDTALTVTWDESANALTFLDTKDRSIETLKFGYQHQILPIAVAENTLEASRTLSLGSMNGKLPADKHIVEYQLIESPRFGEISLNNKTGEWQYTSNQKNAFHHSDEFDFVAIMADGTISAPMSIQLQSQQAPIVSLPGKKVFSITDPIYHEPEPQHHPTPADMHVHSIKLAQTHLMSPDTPYFHLTADRWALLKIDITSPSAAKAPDFIAIVTDKTGLEVGRVPLIGAANLPTELDTIPNIPIVDAQQLHRNSYTAPLKGAWIQPDHQIRIMANNQPIRMPYTDEQGAFPLNVDHSNAMTSHITHTSLYRDGHGIYAFSPISWGKEAVAKLPTPQFTLYSHPATSRSPRLKLYQDGYTHEDTLRSPQYDNPHLFDHLGNEQINWAYQDSRLSANRSGKKTAFHYASVHPSTPILSTLGLAVPQYGGGWTKPSTLWHEIYGHGLGLSHTSAQSYPYPVENNGSSIAYDPSTHRYSLYRYTDDKGNISEIRPALYPYHAARSTEKNDAFLAFSDYHTRQAQQYLKKILRWQPNAVQGQDSEDNGFAGEGFYQWYSTEQSEWQILTQDNYLQFSDYLNPNELTHQRDVPIYSLNGKLLTLPNGLLHPYSYLDITHSIGNLTAPLHNLETRTGRPYSWYDPMALEVTYETDNGLLTEILQIPNSYNEININIEDKGDIVSIDFGKIENDASYTSGTFGSVIYRYVNPDSLAARVFSMHQKNRPLEQLVLDNYWQGSKLHWSSTDNQLIDFKTGAINREYVKRNSALRAQWIANGKLHQRYFSLHEKHQFVDSTQPFTALNHLEDTAFVSDQSTHHYYIPSTISLLSDVHINQQIDLHALNLPSKDACYWVTLCIANKDGEMQEVTPRENWYLSVDKGVLTVKGTLDSTPNLSITGVKVYVDTCLDDDIAASSITIQQNTEGKLAENTEFLNDDKPIVFHSIEQRPEQIAAFPEKPQQLALPSRWPLSVATELIGIPLLI